MIYLQTLVGLTLFILIAFALSENKSGFSLKKVFFGVGIQFALAIFFLKAPYIQGIFFWINRFIIVIQDVTQEAMVFMFGFLAGGKAPYEVVSESHNFIIAFRILPLILVISALSSLLFHLRILPYTIKIISIFLMKTMKLSAPLAFGAGASLFLGTIETPLIIRPYLEKMSRGELLALLCCTMSTVSGTVMALYTEVLSTIFANPTEHLMVASIISVPAALLFSNIVIPISRSKEEQEKAIDVPSETLSVVDALIKGTMDGVQMVISIVAIIIVMFACVFLLNRFTSLLPTEWGIGSVADLGSYVFAPFMWCIGISWDHAFEAGKLMSTKVFLNEFVAYLDLAKAGAAFGQKEHTILTYAFCNFANLASLGIIVGGLISILPKRREELISLGWKSLVIGNLASMMTACVVALLG